MTDLFVSAVACTHSVLCIAGLVNSWGKLWTLEGNGFRGALQSRLLISS